VQTRKVRNVAESIYFKSITGVQGQEDLVLRLRFGTEKSPRTQQQVAEQLGLSLSAVQVIERTALRTLRLSALGPLGEGWNGWDEA
jgi:DNA-directed RNA polymerase sigma subunit (sigma70/sigma32)